MMDLTQPAPTTRTDNPQLLTGNDLLPLTGDEPQTVYVRYVDQVPGFSKDRVRWYRDGMHWFRPDTEHELFITYILVTADIKLVPVGLNPELWFSPVQPGPPPHQLGSVPPIPPLKTYHFWIRFPRLAEDGGGYGYVDPEIIVTPANSNGEGT